MAPSSVSSYYSSTDSTMSDCSDDVFAEPHEIITKKRIRTVITRRHKAKLELIFKKNQYQSRLDLAKIGRELGLPQHALKVRAIEDSFFI